MKLYNALFPFWMLLLFPHFWLIVLPGNFIIDSAVLLIALSMLKIADKKQWYKRYIVNVFTFGMLSDIIGSAYMLLMMTVFRVGRMGDEPYLTFPALIISAALIFVLNYFITFKDLDRNRRNKLAMTFAVVTAPYTFLVPSSLLY